MLVFAYPKASFIVVLITLALTNSTGSTCNMAMRAKWKARGGYSVSDLRP